LLGRRWGDLALDFFVTNTENVWKKVNLISGSWLKQEVPEVCELSNSGKKRREGMEDCEMRT
jgi:hypothetical protein